MEREEIPASVLRNRGVPIVLAQIDDEGNVRTTEDGDPVTEQIYLRFTANEVAEIEEWYVDAKTTIIDPESKMGMEVADIASAFDADLLGRPLRTIRRVLALFFASQQDRLPNEDDVRRAGRRMLAEQQHRYTQMIGAAWSLALGVDPSKVGKALAIQLEIAEHLASAREHLFVAGAEVPIGFPGMTGIESGPESEETRTNSGDSVPVS